MSKAKLEALKQRCDVKQRFGIATDDWGDEVYPPHSEIRYTVGVPCALTRLRRLLVPAENGFIGDGAIVTISGIIGIFVVKHITIRHNVTYGVHYRCELRKEL